MSGPYCFEKANWSPPKDFKTITPDEKTALDGIYLTDVYTPRDTEQNVWVLEAYRRGQQSKEVKP